MAYTKVQFVGYTVFTGPKFEATREIYVGMDSDFDDLAMRVTWTTKVVEILRQSSAVDTDDKTLKVFMMPEFYFRDARGAYPMDIVAELIYFLQESVGGSDGKNWVFVFGSIVGVSSPTYSGIGALWQRALGKDPLAIDESATKEVYNLVVVQQGGWKPSGSVQDEIDAERHAAARIVMKEHKSRIDFVKITRIVPGALAWERVLHLPVGQKSGEGREQQRRNYDGAGIFDLSGIRFGLEICLDHAMQRLKNSPQPKGAERVQFQLVPSCGMTIERKAVVAQSGGYVLNIDGWSTLADALGNSYYGFHSQLEKVEKSYSIGSPATLGPDLTFTTVSLASLPAEEAALIFASGKGEGRVYSSVDVPKPETVS